VMEKFHLSDPQEKKVEAPDLAAQMAMAASPT
jgi:hypothetical protein